MLLNDPEVASLCQFHPRWLVTEAIRSVLRTARNSPKFESISTQSWPDLVSKELHRLKEGSLRRVLNATGVVLHTNLGRAPVNAKWLEPLQKLGSGYINLEFDLDQGTRGSRYSHCAESLAVASGAEDALVVNNNAAAVMLSLHALAHQREVLISRGELVEIGGSFRVPDICEASGARLKEVGTTNRTRCSDFEKAIGEQTAVILKVHPSNYRMEGFVEETPLEELVSLGKKNKIPVVFDVGSASLQAIPVLGSQNVLAKDLIKTGVDLITFSGDKLLGGPQAGIILGKKRWIDRMRKDPWLRILRVDKFTLALLETALLSEEPSTVAKLLMRPLSELKQQAEEFCRHVDPVSHGFRLQVSETESKTGGGSLPEETLPSFGVVFSGSEKELRTFSARLRMGHPPVISRMQKNQLVLDMRTVSAEEMPDLIQVSQSTLKDLRSEGV